MSHQQASQAVLEAADAGFKVAKPGVKFSDVHQAAMQVIAKKTAEWGLLSVTAEVSLNQEVQLHRRWMVHGTSHHLGMDVHDCGQARREMYMDAKLKPGMVFTIEPMLTLGTYHWDMWADGWTVVTKDKSITAQFEHTLVVTETGADILTLA